MAVHSSSDEARGHPDPGGKSSILRPNPSRPPVGRWHPLQRRDSAAAQRPHRPLAEGL